MAYGVEAGVTVLLGGIDTEVFTSANIALAIAHADIIVDSINSSAGDNAKTAASDLISAELLKHSAATKKLKGLSSDGGFAGRLARSGEGHYYHIPPIVYKILAATSDEPTFTTTTPEITGEW